MKTGAKKVHRIIVKCHLGRQNDTEMHPEVKKDFNKVT